VTQTQLLYHDDPYRRDFDAAVVAVAPDRSAVALEQTAFFATGGPVRVVKTESKGKANKRVRIAVDE
jgi:Ser-tRNA(Ala) deacylase AlaX